MTTVKSAAIPRDAARYGSTKSYTDNDIIPHTLIFRAGDVILPAVFYVISLNGCVLCVRGMLSVHLCLFSTLHLTLLPSVLVLSVCSVVGAIAV